MKERPATLCVAPPHRWRIETPNGPTVRGECRHCGAEKVFVTAPDDGMFQEEYAKGRELNSVARPKSFGVAS